MQPYSASRRHSCKPAAVAAERSAEERFFYGKWVTTDRLQSVEFFPDGTCVITSHVKGNTAIDISMYQGTVRAKSSLYSGGTDIQCGGAGAFSAWVRTESSFLSRVRP